MYDQMKTIMEPDIDETTHNNGKEDVTVIEKYLTFLINNEEYGIEILKVKEIISIPSITPIPQSPLYLKGVINLRGAIIPVIDLRLMLKMSENCIDSKTCIIVVALKNSLIGMIVDRVSEVITVDIKRVDTDYKIESKYIRGISQINNKSRILLDIDNMIENKMI